MHPLLAQLQPLLAAEDIEAITALLERWAPRDEVWVQCVQGRLFAPSSDASQRQRLRAVIKEYESSPPAPAAPEQQRTAVDAAPRSAAGDPSEVLQLPGMEARLAAAADALAELPPETRETARQILAIVRRENQRHERRRRIQYEEQLTDRRLPATTRFPQFLESLSNLFVQVGSPTGESEIDALEALSPVPFSASLRAFYRTVGRLTGACGEAGMGVRLHSAGELLEAHRRTQRWERLPSLSLLDMVRWVWGNDRPELAPGVLPASVERAAERMLCVGWLSDDFGEQHGYVVQRADGAFQVHLWHQDDEFTLPDESASHAADLWVLLHDILRRLVGAPDENATPPEDLTELIEAMNDGSP